MAGESVVRSRAASIFGEAAVMLLVGFYMFEPNLSGSELSDYAAFATVWTFRGGGIALLVLAGLCLSGRREALLANAGLDLAIGVVFAGSGVILLMAGSGVQAMLVALFGVMSLGSARWDWNTWRSVSVAAGAGMVTATGSLDDTAVEPVDPDRAAGRADALKRIVESKRVSRTEATCCRPDADKSARSSTPAPVVKPEPPTIRVEPRPNEPPPEGFLADLGRDDSEGR